ncbi:MAG TPA: hypothetical protein VMU81_17245 [Acetobacteraceae bacterium]|nr:hypothetical protein [Acetobacteraceae bacterium]
MLSAGAFISHAIWHLLCSLAAVHKGEARMDPDVCPFTRDHDRPVSIAAPHQMPTISHPIPATPRIPQGAARLPSP